VSADDAVCARHVVELGRGSTPSTSGTLATLTPRPARYVESGVFEVRLTPTSTRSAFLRLRGSLPSSLFTANSTASMRRKYSFESGSIALGRFTGSRSRNAPSLPMSEPMTSTASTLVLLRQLVEELAQLGRTTVNTTMEPCSRPS
jgi:hypothetical protein